MITINNLVKKYGRVQALDNVSCFIPEETICALVGPNGAGKSTLLKILTRILPYDAGAIEYGTALRNGTFQQNIAYLPEQRGLYTGVDIETQLAFFANIRGLSDRKAQESVSYWLNKLGISSWGKRRVSELSKGMQQKVQFVSSLVGYPAIMFMDEPFSGVDPINFHLFMDVLEEYQKDTGATIILSTHNMKSVEELCKYVILLNKGKVEIEGNVNEVKQSYTKGNALLIEVAGTQDTIGDIVARLAHSFQVTSKSLKQGHLFLEISDDEPSSCAASMQKALQLLDGYEVYQCQRKMVSMEEIFINLSNNR